MSIIKNNNFLIDIKKAVILFFIFIIPVIFTGQTNKHDSIKTISSDQIPVAEAAGEISVAYMGDARPSKFGTPGITELTKDFNQVVAQSPTGKVGAVFLIGDFDTIPQTKQAYTASTLNTGTPKIPVYFVVGNHEAATSGDVAAIKTWNASSPIPLTPGPLGTEKTTYSMDIGNMHIININEYWDGKNNDSIGKGVIADLLQDWINKNLAASAPACKVVLGHEPLYPKNRHVGESLDANPANRNRLQASFVANKVGVFVGAHTHYAVVNTYENVIHIDTGVSGDKVTDGEDPYASIFYTHVDATGKMILTWKKENGTSWSTGGTYTAQCGVGGPPPPPPPPPGPDTTPPTVAIKCPADGANVNTPAINVVGTASDNVGVSKVQVKNGPGGTWLDATSTDNWANWSISNFALVPGANTIYAQAIDTSGNTTPLNSVFIRVNFAPPASPPPGSGTCPALGNFQKSNADPATQNNPKITYDAFTDGRVDNFHRSSPVQTILEYYVDSWDWSPSGIQARFKLARDNAGKTDYLAFLMNEEIVQPSRSGWYILPDGRNWRFPGGYGGYSTSYGVQTFEGVPVNYGAGSTGFFLDMLKAWKQLCLNLNKKCALVGDAQSPNSFYNDMYGADGVKYIAQNFDMIYLYAYPTSVSNANCGNGICAKSKIDFWRGLGFNGKINYLLTTDQFGGNDAIVAADFKNAADAGADIISTYPYKRVGDTLATARMMQIWDNYKAAGCTAPVNTTPLCPLPGGPGPSPTPCIPSCPSGCAAVGQDDGCGGTCPNNQGNTCDDNNACTLGDLCSGGSCQGGTPKTCGSTSSCSSYTCNSSTGNCDYVSKDGSSCDDGNKCTLNDTCSGGLCRGMPMNCSDGVACTIDFCTDGTCKNTDVCGGLVPCGRLVDNPATNEINEKAPCNLCTTIYMIKELINFVVKIAFALALLSLVIAGFLYFTSLGDSHQVQKAKNVLYYTAVGLLIVFLAWLAIAAILQAFGYANITTWNQVNCSIVVDSSSQPISSVTPPSNPFPSSSAIPSTSPGPSTSSSPSLSPGPIPGPLSGSCTHLVYNQGTQVVGKSITTGSIVVTGTTLNQVLSGVGNGIGKSGNHICIQKGNYNLSTIIDMQPNLIIECEYQDDSNRAYITGSAPTSDNQLISIKSDSVIKNCTFDHKGFTIAAMGAVDGWRVENNYFLNSVIAVFVHDDTLVSGNPKHGNGFILNNKGLHSKLSTLQDTTGVTLRGNSFADRNGPEQVDFNYNVYNVLMEYNTFINGPEFTLSEEVIDMIGGNSFNNSNNTVRYNTIIGAFRTGIRPAKSANDNILDHNYIKFIQGTSTVVNVAGIYFYGGGNDFSTPKRNKVTNNTIIGAKVGIELSGTNDNTVTGNDISAVSKGIAVMKDSSSGYGASQVAKNNIITGNTIDNVDYGIYVQSSLLTNTISPNTITNFRIKNIEVIP